jgi:hypothetical protein
MRRSNSTIAEFDVIYCERASNFDQPPAPKADHTRMT